MKAGESVERSVPVDRWRDVGGDRFLGRGTVVRGHDSGQPSGGFGDQIGIQSDVGVGVTESIHPLTLRRADRVVADSVSQCVDHGECFHAVKENKIGESSILELGKVIKNPDIGRTSEDQITVADLTGVAIQDIQIAKMVNHVLHSGIQP